VGGPKLKFLLDTHAALWWWLDAPQLSETARQKMADPDNEIYFSAASAYEIFQKVRLGRLIVPKSIQDNLPKVIRDEGWIQLPLTIAEATMAAGMEHTNRDPIDRMLAAQSQLGDYSIVSVDGFFDAVPVTRIW
jgi:PIN domain nuclease of toxin-antitoxin system